MSDIEVRPITEADLASLGDHERRRFRGTLDNQHEMLVGLLGGVPVGSVLIGGPKRDRFPGALYLFALDVEPRFQNRGVGTAIIAAVEEEARQRGLNRVNLEVGVANDAARRLYERLGFAECGEATWDSWTIHREDGSTFEEGEMCVPMVKELE